MHFINSFDPIDDRTKPRTRNARSHAARYAHAKARRIRMAAHQASIAAIRHQDGSSDEDERLAVQFERVVKPTIFCLEQKSSTEQAVGLLTMTRKDPFGSFPKPLTHNEHFLFDHCKEIPILRALACGSTSAAFI